MSQRKDDHIAFALAHTPQSNDFDKMHFVHVAIPSTNLSTIDLTTQLGPFTLSTPFFINAMTGGSDQSTHINEKLAHVAKACDLVMATGSVSIALKNPSLTESFTIIERTNPTGIRFANVGAGSSWNQVNQAASLIHAHACQIHVNALQEIVMPEGERDFSTWWQHLRECVQKSHVPLIVKEVGFGMSPSTLRKLEAIGITMVDVSGKGGTDFAWIENQRRTQALPYFNHWGLSTCESLLSVKGQLNIDLIASGGIRNALDIAKAIAAGAKAVGLSSYFLKLVTQYSVEEAIIHVENLKTELKMIMGVLDVATIAALAHAPYVIDLDLAHRIEQLKNT